MSTNSSTTRLGGISYVKYTPSNMPQYLHDLRAAITSATPLGRQIVDGIHARPVEVTTTTVDGSGVNGIFTPSQTVSYTLGALDEESDGYHSDGSEPRRGVRSSRDSGRDATISFNLSDSFGAATLRVPYRGGREAPPPPQPASSAGQPDPLQESDAPARDATQEAVDGARNDPLEAPRTPTPAAATATH